MLASYCRAGIANYCHPNRNLNPTAEITTSAGNASSCHKCWHHPATLIKVCTLQQRSPWASNVETKDRVKPKTTPRPYAGQTPGHIIDQTSAHPGTSELAPCCHRSSAGIHTGTHTR